MGTGDPSVSLDSTRPIRRYTLMHVTIQVAEYIAECQRVLKKSGLKYKVRGHNLWRGVH
jgi:hypothetical protein